MMRNSVHTQPAQILLVTVIVLMIIAIIVVGVISLANRDVQQTISNQQYQQILNASEVQVLDFVEKYGNSITALTEIGTNETNCQLQAQDKYECELVTSQDGINSVLSVQDKNEFENYQLARDESLELDLVSDKTTYQGFRGEIQFDYTGTTALEFALYYEDSGEYLVERDVFDLTNGQLFDVVLGDPRIPNPNHPFNFGFDSNTQRFYFRINDITGYPVTAEARTLRITARMPDGQALTELDISANSGGLSAAIAGTFPDQVREFAAVSFLGGEDSNIVATVVTQVPLLAQTPGFMHSGLLVNSNIDKQNN